MCFFFVKFDKTGSGVAKNIHIISEYCLVLILSGDSNKSFDFLLNPICIVVVL